MKILGYLLLIVSFIGIVIFLIGLILPETRVVTRETTYQADIKAVYNTMTNNQDWQYRTSLDNLEILSKDGDSEIWRETTNNVHVLFKTKEKQPFETYSFEMSNRYFKGVWIAKLMPVGVNQTHVEATESITFSNPFIRTLGYLFMDLDKFMQTYEDELRAKLEKD